MGNTAIARVFFIKEPSMIDLELYDIEDNRSYPYSRHFYKDSFVTMNLYITDISTLFIF